MRAEDNSLPKAQCLLKAILIMMITRVVIVARAQVLLATMIANIIENNSNSPSPYNSPFKLVSSQYWRTCRHLPSGCVLIGGSVYCYYIL